MAVNVETGSVVACANKIDSYNKSIRNDFSAVESAMSSLDRCWDGGVSNNAIREFGKIKDDFFADRYSVIDNMKSFLINVVSTGYEEAEKALTSASKAFK